VRLWDRVRSPEAIAANKSRRLSGSEAGLVGYWPLDEGVDAVVLDETDNNNHGTISGNALWVESDLPVKVVE